jgi:uncharacterized protein YjbI with pentapeptide repeats
LSRPVEETQPPRIDRVQLADLSAGSVDELVARADLDGARFAGLQADSLVLSDARIMECEVADVLVDTADLRGSRLRESVLTTPNLTLAKAARSDWANVRVEGARIGALEAYEAQWHAIHVVGGKLSYVNFRGATLTDVLFTDCHIEELDLSQATAKRVAFAGCRIDSLDVHDSELDNVDLRLAQLATIVGIGQLRGATVSAEQLADLAPLLAAEAGIMIG